MKAAPSAVRWPSAHAMLLLRFDEPADVPRNVFDGLGPPEVGGELAVRAREQPLRRRALPRFGRDAQLGESRPLGVGGRRRTAEHRAAVGVDERLLDRSELARTG